PARERRSLPIAPPSSRSRIAAEAGRSALFLQALEGPHHRREFHLPPLSFQLPSSDSGARQGSACPLLATAVARRLRLRFHRSRPRYASGLARVRREHGGRPLELVVCHGLAQ